jgi:predicted ATPase
VTLNPLTIEILAPYKSIEKGLVWKDIPAFSVLTGLNGSGKTHLLELLAYSISGANIPPHGSFTSSTKLTGDTIGPKDIAFIPDRWVFGGSPLIGIAEMQQAKQQLHSELRNNKDVGRIALRHRIEQLIGKRVEQLDQGAFAKLLPDDFVFLLEEANLARGLAHLFVAHRLQMLRELEQGTHAADLEKKLGPTPWDVVNEILKAGEFPYQVNSPQERSLTEQYEVLLVDKQSDKNLRPHELSSGEQTLLAVALWLFNSKHYGRYPKLFLMDEPDAHLHPSMTRQFLNVLKDVLVERYGVRVMLTTHSPSTVALAPDGSLFEMRRTPPRIVASPSKASTIGLLTAGLVTVSPATRYVLVEDEDDVEFYEALRDILTEYGPSRDVRAIKPSPTLVFLPASTGKGKGKTGGGNSVVEGWITKLEEPPLAEIIRGAIDRDAANVGSPRLKVLGRYSIENYMLDPFVVFGILLSEGKAFPAAKAPISAGDEHLIRGLSEGELQSIVAGIQAIVEPKLGALTASLMAPKVVTFTNGRKVEYPAWMLDYRGHDLLPIFQAEFGGPKVISHPRLFGMLRRVRLLPVELADIFDELQA